MAAIDQRGEEARQGRESATRAGSSQIKSPRRFRFRGPYTHWIVRRHPSTGRVVCVVVMAAARQGPRN